VINLIGPYLIAFLVLAGVVTFAALVVIIVVARVALAKAHARDVPDVLIGLAVLVGALPWMGYARGPTTMNRSLRQEGRTSPTAEESAMAPSEDDVDEVEPR